MTRRRTRAIRTRAGSPRKYQRTPSTSQNDRLTSSDDDDEGENLRDRVNNKKEGAKKDGGVKKRTASTGGKKKNSKTRGRVHVASGTQKGKKNPRAVSGRDTVASSGDDDDDVHSDEEKEPTPLPESKGGGRRAKKSPKVTYKDSSDSDASLGFQFPGPISKDRDSDADYDSDKDPAWKPVAVDNKKQPTYDEDDSRFGPKVKRGRPKGEKKGHWKTSIGTKRPGDKLSTSQPVVKLQKLSPSQTLKLQKVREPVATVAEKTCTASPEKDKNSVGDSNDTRVETTPPIGYQTGEFILNKKDLTNYENFPIWRIESGKLIRKFELITEDGRMTHRSMYTFSSWLPTMHNDYLPIKTKFVSGERGKEEVEVVEQDRPTPKLDISLEHAYEEDPLADLFTVYLQIFLSQALDPGFLSAIGEGKEKFYLGPLQSIDKTIEKKLEEIEKKVQWKSKIKDALSSKPNIRELDRTNLKQLCQASEQGRQTAIKSVHLFGQSYDKFTLEDNKDKDESSTEFMVGKMAANYVRTCHSLYHFKYNLSKRCLAKVDIVRQSDSKLNNSEVLDRCLSNRTWVLKIFDDLKTMLDKG